MAINKRYCIHYVDLMTCGANVSSDCIATNQVNSKANDTSFPAQTNSPKKCITPNQPTQGATAVPQEASARRTAH